MDEKMIELETVMELLQGRHFAELRELLRDANTIDVAQLLGEVPDDKLLLLYRLLPKEDAADVFSEMEHEEQEMLIRAFNDREIREVLEEMYIDDAVDMIEEMPAVVVNKILRHADPETRKEINELLQYPEDSAGSVMTTEYMSLKSDMTVADAFERIRRTADEKEDIYTCYVVSPSRKLQGIVSLKDMFLVSKETLIGDIMETNIISANTLDDQEQVAKDMAKYNLTTIPIVDKEQRLVGIVTVDDAIDVIQEENTEDIEMMAAITPTDKPYISTGFFETYKKRIPWLLLLMISATFTGAIITKYESALGKYVILTAYIPMLMDTGGNAGSQASVSIIRGLSLDEIEFKDIFRIQGKELLVALLCGTTLAIANFVKLLVFDKVAVVIALVVCSTLLLTVAVAKFVGCSLPILAKRIGFDPAVMASPFITTIVDAISLIIYFQLASHILHM
ncbi:magnesium transporter [Lachnospiraceae bacterium NE2001]|nr:magnesium transporter [Lachnospiraceae bacterium NE2001]